MKRERKREREKERKKERGREREREMYLCSVSHVVVTVSILLACFLMRDT